VEKFFTLSFSFSRFVCVLNIVSAGETCVLHLLDERRKIHVRCGIGIVHNSRKGAKAAALDQTQREINGSERAS
jgi:hypothetical protein